MSGARRSGTAIPCVLADDHDAMRAAVRSRLELLEWLDVVDEASDGTEALAAIERHRPPVAIVDARMPGMAGFEVCRVLASRNIDTRVILYSAFVDEETVAHARAVGAAALVSKEGGFASLRERLEELRADICSGT